MKVAIDIDGEFVEFGDSQRITLYFRNSLFSFDVVEGNKSLPFSFPATPHNRRLTGFYDRAEVEGEDSVTATLWVVGNPYRTGRLKYSYNNGEFSGTFFWGLASKATELKDFKLSQLSHQVNMYSIFYGPNPDARLHVPGVGAHLPHEVGAEYTLRVQRDDGSLIEVTHTATTADRLDAFVALRDAFMASHSTTCTIHASDNGETDPLLRVFTLACVYPQANNMLILEVGVTSADGSTEKRQRFLSDDARRYATDQFYSSQVYFPALHAGEWEKDEMYRVNRSILGAEYGFTQLNRTIQASYSSTLSPCLNAGWVVNLLSAQMGFLVRNNVPGDAKIFTAQDLNHQHSFVVGDLLPDMSASDFLKALAQVFCLQLTYDNELNILHIDRKGTLINKNLIMLIGAPPFSELRRVVWDYTDKLYYYQGYHEKKNQVVGGFTLGWQDGPGADYLEGKGELKLRANASTLRNTTSADDPFRALSTTLTIPAWDGEGYQYRVPDRSGRIDKLVLITQITDTEQPQAGRYNWQSLHNAYWRNFLDLWLNRPELRYPATFNYADMFTLGNNMRILVDDMLFWTEEVRLELGDDEVAGEIICKRIL